MNDTIPLAADGGLSPHLTYCPRCQGPAEEITVGDVRKYTFHDKRVVFAYSRDIRRIMQDLGYFQYEKTETPGENEKLPATQPCNSCKEEEEKFAKVVVEGGIYFRCLGCGVYGVIKDSPFAEAVKKTAKVEKDQPCGCTFDTCDQHEGMIP